jgi:Holliday junction resolvase RusA-like endonuclease
VSALTPAEQERAMRELGIPAEKIEQALGVRTALPVKVARNLHANLRAAPGVEFVSVDTIRLRIPWSALVSDNAKMRAARKGDQATVVLTPAYRAAKKAIGALATETMQGRPALDVPLKLEARVYVPDNRVHDVCNFSKALHDALKGTVFTDDRWLYDTRWVRAGVDVDAPRAEISISPLCEAA